ncbi:MAG: GNAT family acetyltransferase [Saprospiraceae bacterium]|nr:MAG: GNAT family acetyltransferase [Saprospiraceae bacterium]
MMRVKAFPAYEARQWLPEVARLRIEVFREFPYLYDGDLDYEKRYLDTLFGCRDAVLVLAFDGDRVVGASTGMPLAEETDNIRKPFEQSPYPVEGVFYFSESVLDKRYRGQGIGKRFFEERENWARQLGDYEWLAFCAVVRSQDDPRRPADYKPLDAFWRKRGFEPTDLYCQIAWKEIGEEDESPKSLRFWVKPLG